MPGDYQTKDRMELKLAAIPLPENLTGKRVLDIGCDHGYWTNLCAKRGATISIGLDRGREVKGQGWKNLAFENRTTACENARFIEYHAGTQWLEFDRFDLVLMMSVYHHIYQSCGGDHNPIWYWIWRQCQPISQVIYEGPIDTSDGVVKKNVSHEYQQNFHIYKIIGAASRYFDNKMIGPALHVPTREVWAFQPKRITPEVYSGKVTSGAGGASKAFEYKEKRRIKEFKYILGIECVPGSLNVILSEDFAWDTDYYRTRILDVADRSKGLDSEWHLRWARIYPISINGHQAFVFRFEGERYPKNMVEIISDIRLRDHVEEEVRIVKN